MSGARLDHVQLAIPAAGEDQARAFYGAVLGLREIAKPVSLAGRGGLWFVLEDGLGLHLGVDPDFRCAAKAHPGLIFQDFDGLRSRLERAEWTFRVDLDHAGRDRLYLRDPFGNRIEVIRDSG